MLHPFWWWVGNIHLLTFDCLVIIGNTYHSWVAMSLMDLFFKFITHLLNKTHKVYNKMEYFIPNLFSFPTSTWRLGSNHGGNKTLKQKVKETGIWKLKYHEGINYHTSKFMHMALMIFILHEIQDKKGTEVHHRDLGIQIIDFTPNLSLQNLLTCSQILLSNFCL